MMWFSVICETLILPNIKGKGDKIQINYWGGGGVSRKLTVMKHNWTSPDSE